MHYEINTTTRRGKNLYPYLDCAEKDPITQNDTTVCRDLLAEHSDDPIVFHEKYKDQGTIVASEDTFHGSAEPESEEVEDVVIEEETTDEIVVDEVSIDDDDDTNDNQEENEEEIDSNLSDTNT